MYWIYFLAISGLFGKSKQDLELLPPPPPFPKIEEDMIKQEVSIQEENGKKKQQELESRKIEENRRKELERKKEVSENQKKQKLTLKRNEELKKNKELMKERRKKIRGKSFDFFNKLGFIKTEEDKKEFVRQKQEYKELKKIKRIEKDIKISQEQFILKKEIQRKEEAKSKPIFDKFFSKKDDKIEPVEIKSDIPKISADKDIGKPHEILEAEKEIQRAIEGIKKMDDGKPILKKLFSIKEKIEKPDLIPQFEEKVGSVDSIEAKMHRTRLALMDFKFDEAKRIYVEIMKIYKDLEPKKKARVYLDIKDLYYERKTAEKYAK